MTAFRALLVTLWVILVVYTVVVIENHGLGLLAIFFADMQRMAWPGQFNLDFMMLLTLSALWVAWRHQFTPPGLALALLAQVGGSLFLCTYLLVVSWRCNGEMASVLVGPGRVST